MTTNTIWDILLVGQSKNIHFVSGAGTASSHTVLTLWCHCTSGQRVFCVYLFIKLLLCGHIKIWTQTCTDALDKVSPCTHMQEMLSVWSGLTTCCVPQISNWHLQVYSKMLLCSYQHQMCEDLWKDSTPIQVCYTTHDVSNLWQVWSLGVRKCGCGVIPWTTVYCGLQVISCKIRVKFKLCKSSQSVDLALLLYWQGHSAIR